MRTKELAEERFGSAAHKGWRRVERRKRARDWAAVEKVGKVKRPLNALSEATIETSTGLLLVDWYGGGSDMAAV